MNAEQQPAVETTRREMRVCLESRLLGSLMALATVRQVPPAAHQVRTD